jgi:CBS domain-containing protein
VGQPTLTGIVFYGEGQLQGAHVACRIESLVSETVATLDQQQTVQHAAELMARQNIGSLVITDNGHVVGLFTERDLLRRVVGEGHDPRSLAVGDVCTRNLVSIAHDSSCQQAVIKMQTNRCRRLMVVRGAEFSGMVSLQDIANAMAENGGRKDLLVNIVGAITLVVAVGVIGMLIYQLPDMLQFAGGIGSR